MRYVIYDSVADEIYICTYDGFYISTNLNFFIRQTEYSFVNYINSKKYIILEEVEV